jgi:hypothetical protein
MRTVASRRYDPAVLRARAERFSTDRFEASFRGILHDALTMPAGAW